MLYARVLVSAVVMHSVGCAAAEPKCIAALCSMEPLTGWEHCVWSVHGCWVYATLLDGIMLRQLVWYAAAALMLTPSMPIAWCGNGATDPSDNMV
jgi:hypothetical protein